MALNLNDVGLQGYAPSGSLCETLDYEKKVDIAGPIMQCDSSFGQAGAFDPTYTFNLKGKGDVPAVFLIGDDFITDTLTLAGDATTAGTRLITSIKEGERHDDFNDWEVSGVYFPSAV